MLTNGILEKLYCTSCIIFLQRR